MKLFVQVAFDLEYSQAPEYKSVEVWLNGIGLTRKIIDVAGEQFRLPANTFAGVRDCYRSCEEAVRHVREQFEMAGHLDFCAGVALITASPADMTTYGVYRFGG